MCEENKTSSSAVNFGGCPYCNRCPCCGRPYNARPYEITCKGPKVYSGTGTITFTTASSGNSYWFGADFAKGVK